MQFWEALVPSRVAESACSQTPPLVRNPPHLSASEPNLPLHPHCGRPLLTTTYHCATQCSLHLSCMSHSFVSVGLTKHRTGCTVHSRLTAPVPQFARIQYRVRVKIWVRLGFRFVAGAVFRRTGHCSVFLANSCIMSV